MRFMGADPMKTVLAALSLLMLSATPGLCADTVSVLYNERPPYLVTTPQGVTGLTGEPTAKAFAKAGIAIAWKEVPAPRQLKMIQDNTDEVCAPGWFKNPDREKFAHFSTPIYQDKPTAIVGRAGDAKLAHVASVDALLGDKGLTLLVKQSYSYGTFLDGKIASLAPNKTTTPAENVQMAKMIAAHRADYMFAAPEEADDMLKSPDLSKAGLAIYPVAGMPAGGDRYILCSMKVPESVMSALDKALAQ